MSAATLAERLAVHAAAEARAAQDVIAAARVKFWTMAGKLATDDKDYTDTDIETLGSVLQTLGKTPDDLTNASSNLRKLAKLSARFGSDEQSRRRDAHRSSIGDLTATAVDLKLKADAAQAAVDAAHHEQRDFDNRAQAKRRKIESLSVLLAESGYKGPLVSEDLVAKVADSMPGKDPRFTVRREREARASLLEREAAAVVAERETASRQRATSDAHRAADEQALRDAAACGHPATRRIRHRLAHATGFDAPVDDSFDPYERRVSQR